MIHTSNYHTPFALLIGKTPIQSLENARVESVTIHQWRHPDFCFGGAKHTFCPILGANLVFLLIEIPNIGGAKAP